MRPVYTVIIMLVLLVVSSGCAAFVPNLTPTPKPTPVPTTVITTVPTTVATPLPTTVITTIPTTVATTEPTPTEPVYTGYYYLPGSPDPSTVVTVEIPEINPVEEYLTYSDNDFSVRYPGNWTVTRSAATVINNQLGGTDKFKPESRIVLFQSQNSSVNFTAETKDYLLPGNHGKLVTTLDHWSKTITPRFFDVAGTTGQITNFEVRYTTQSSTPYVTFDVIIPQGSVFYPHTYTERDLDSFSHTYTFRFNTPGNLEDYREVRRVMFDSLQTEENVMKKEG